MLAGMDQTEAAYLEQIVQIIGKVKLVRVMRPSDIRIAEMYESVRDFLAGKDNTIR
jgi:hypothetical protein